MSFEGFPYWYFGLKSPQKALYVLELNTKIFP